MSTEKIAGKKEEIEELRLEVERQHLELERANMIMLKRKYSGPDWPYGLAMFSVVMSLIAAVAAILALFL